jgi:hypothetical protein
MMRPEYSSSSTSDLGRSITTRDERNARTPQRLADHGPMILSAAADNDAIEPRYSIQNE